MGMVEISVIIQGCREVVPVDSELSSRLYAGDELPADFFDALDYSELSVSEFYNGLEKDGLTVEESSTGWAVEEAS